VVWAASVVWVGPEVLVVWAASVVLADQVASAASVVRVDRVA